MSGFALKSPPEKKKICFWAGLVNRSSPRFVSSLRFCPSVTLVSEIAYGNWWWVSFLKVHVQMCPGIRSGVPALIFSALFPPSDHIKAGGFFCCFTLLSVLLFFQWYCGASWIWFGPYTLLLSLVLFTDDTGIFKCLQKQKKD